MDIRKEMQDAAFFRALAGGEFCVWYQPQVDMRLSVSDRQPPIARRVGAAGW